MAYQDEQKYLDAYVGKLLEIQTARQEAPLSQDELRQIAESVGMTEADWQEAQRVLQTHLRNGQAHLRAQNWTDALRDFEQALTLNPHLEQALYGAAKSAQELHAQTASAAFLAKARQYADRALQNQDTSLDASAIQLLKTLQAQQASHGQQRSRMRWVVGAIVGLIFLGFGVFLLTANSSARTLDQAAKAQWAQVENVYQRRADLIPKITATAQAGNAAQQAKLQQIQAIQQKIAQSQGDPAAYAQHQDELGKELTALIQTMQDPTATNQITRDLLVQIEGAENRIAIERKRYNEAVQAYNNKIGGFPYGMLGYAEKPYFKAGQ